MQPGDPADQNTGTGPTRSNAKLLTFILLIALLCFQLFKVFNTEVWRDDAIFAATAKNMLEGHGYGIALYDRFTLFHPSISSGPVIILPAVLAIKLFGNQFWVPGLTSVLLIDVLLLLLYWRFKAIAPDAHARWTTSAFFLSLALILTNADTGNIGQPLALWHALMGDIPSALLVILAALVLAKPSQATSPFIMAGLLLGLAMLCKLQAVLGGAALGILLLWRQFFILKGDTKRVVKSMRAGALFSAGILLPQLLFEIGKMLRLGGVTAYLENLRYLGSFIGSLHAGDHYGDGLFERAYMLGRRFFVTPFFELGSAIYCLIALMFAGLVFLLVLRHVIYRLRTTDSLLDPIAFCALSLAMAAVLHTSWYLFINQWAMPRYLTQSMLYGCAALALMLYARMQKNPRMARGWIVLLISFALVCRADALVYWKEGLARSPGLTEQTEAFNALQDLRKKDPTVVFFSCGSSFEMEYLLPGVSNFVHCSQLERARYRDHPKVLLSYYLSDTGKMLHYPEHSFNAQGVNNSKAVTARCPHNDIYESAHYSIASCAM